MNISKPDKRSYNERDCCAEDHHASHPKPDLTTIRAQVRQVADKNGIKYPVLLIPPARSAGVSMETFCPVTFSLTPRGTSAAVSPVDETCLPWKPWSMKSLL